MLCNIITMFAKSETPMNRRNIFNGDSNRSIFANYIYARLISREWFTYSDVIKDFDIRNQEPDKISSSKYYNIIKKAFSIVLTAVKKKRVTTQ